MRYKQEGQPSSEPIRNTHQTCVKRVTRCYAMRLSKLDSYYVRSVADLLAWTRGSHSHRFIVN